MSDLKPWEDRSRVLPPPTSGLLQLPDRMHLPDGPLPQDVPDDVPVVIVCGAKYGRVSCYKIEGHPGTHAGMSKLEWG